MIPRAYYRAEDGNLYRVHSVNTTTTVALIEYYPDVPTEETIDLDRIMVRP